MWRPMISVFAAALAVCPVVGAAAPTVGPDGVLRYPLNERTPPTLACAPLFVCDLALEPGETIANVAVGDSVRWLIAPALNGASGGTVAHLLIKPVEAGLRTNLVVTTNRRTYEVLLVARPSDPMLRVGFAYPQNRHASPHRPDARASSAASPSPAALDFAYRLSGDRRLQPLRVYNDGVRTYVQMPPELSELPVLFVMGDDGGDALANYRVTADHVYIIDGVPGGMTLVDGTGKHRRRALIDHEARI